MKGRSNRRANARMSVINGDGNATKKERGRLKYGRKKRRFGKRPVCCSLMHALCTRVPFCIQSNSGSARLKIRDRAIVAAIVIIIIM